MDKFVDIDNILNTFNKFENKDLHYFQKKLNVSFNNLQNFESQIIDYILNIIQVNRKFLYEKNILLFPVLISEKGSIKNNFPLSLVFKEENNENFDFLQSNFYKKLISKFIFVIFQKDNENTIIKKTFTFKFDSADFNKANLVYKNTMNLFKNGGSFWKDENKDIHYNFIKFSSGSMFFVSPINNSFSNTYKTDAGEIIKKQYFWLNKKYLEEKFANLFNNLIYEENRNFGLTIEQKIFGIIKENKKLVYKDEKNNYWNDWEISNTNLSVRSINGLLKKSIYSFKQLLNMEISKFSKIKNLGKKSNKEILSYIRNNFFIVDADKKVEIFDNKIIFSNNKEFIRKKRILKDFISSHKNSIIKFLINNNEVEDSYINVIPFSERAKNCLFKKGVSKLSELILMSIEEFESIDNLGKTTFKNIITWLKNNSVEIELKEVDVNNEKFLLINKFVNNLDWKGFSFNKKTFSVIVFNQLKDSNIDIFSIDIFKNLNITTDFYNYLKNYIIYIIKNNEFLNFSELLNLTIDGLIKEWLLEKILQELLSDKKILKINNYYFFKYPLFKDFLLSYSEENEKIKIIYERIVEGKTLQEVGEKFNKSRERIRQIINKFFDNLSNTFFYEDTFKKFFEKYDFDGESIKEILELEFDSYNYLNFKYKSGNIELIEMEKNADLPIWIIDNCKNFLTKKYFLINGNYFKKNRKSILNYFLSEECRNDINFKDFYEKYNNFLVENNFDLELFKYPKNTLLNKLSESFFVLWKTGQNFRYYDISQINIDFFWKNLNLESFNNKEISAKIILDLHKELMDEIDVRDEYELHNLMKKTFPLYNNHLNFKIEFNRMPIIALGSCDRNQQVLDLLLQENEIKREDLAIKYEEIYGVKRQSVSANFFDCINTYYENSTGSYKVRENILDEKSLLILQSKLISDFYTFDQIKIIFQNTLSNTNLSFLNSYTLKKLGFNILKNLVYKSNFPSFEKFLENYIHEQKFVDFSYGFSDIFNNTTFYNAIYNLQKKYKIIEYEKNKFISIKKINEIGYEINDFHDFVNEVIKISEKSFFTFFQIEDMGFYHKIFELGFSQYFYESILKVDERIRVIKIGNTTLFKESTSQISTEKFIVHLMSNFIKKDIFEFMNYVLEKYNIKINKTKLISNVNNAGLYYSNIKEKIYLDYDEYFKEI